MQYMGHLEYRMQRIDCAKLIVIRYYKFIFVCFVIFYGYVFLWRQILHGGSSPSWAGYTHFREQNRQTARQTTVSSRSLYAIARPSVCRLSGCLSVCNVRAPISISRLKFSALFVKISTG